jgi:hypothetical protein
LSEHDALQVLAVVARRFGWVCVIWNREAVNDALNDLALANRPQVASEHARQLTDEEWTRVTQTPAWREAIPDTAITRVADEDLLTDAILQAAVVCAECLAPLADPPSVTGRLCQLHRTGPAGQPAVADPATEGLYWLDGDTLTHAPIDSQRRSPCKDAGEPVDWSELDPLATYRAEQAQAALRALAAPTTTTPTANRSESDSP